MAIHEFKCGKEEGMQNHLCEAWEPKRTSLEGKSTESQNVVA